MGTHWLSRVLAISRRTATTWGPLPPLASKSRSKAFRSRLIRHEVAIGPACTSPRSCLHQPAPTTAPSAPMTHFAAHRACPQAHSCHRQRLHAHPRPALTSTATAVILHMCTLYQYAALVSFAPWKPIHRAASYICERGWNDKVCRRSTAQH